MGYTVSLDDPLMWIQKINLLIEMSQETYNKKLVNIEKYLADLVTKNNLAIQKSRLMFHASLRSNKALVSGLI